MMNGHYLCPEDKGRRWCELPVYGWDGDDS